MSIPSSQDDDLLIENMYLVNGNAVPLHILFEPWLDEYDLPPGEKIIISTRGPLGGGVGIEFRGADSCVVWGWVGSSMAVVHNSNLVIDYRDQKLPLGPPGTYKWLSDWLWKDY